MKALRIDAHGGAEAMRVVDVPVPQPGPGEVLVKVGAASLNPIDWKMRNGEMRAFFEFPLPHTLGRDFAGTVAAVGEGVTDLETGTRVFGAGNPMRDGTHAEYVVAPRPLMARTPAALTDVAAATIPVAGISALIPLVEVANLTTGQRVLIHAGAGGVGTFAVQIARHLGADVVATASARNIAYVTQLGAHRVIDYTASDFSAQVRDCDVVLDTMGGDVHRRSFACLKAGGVLAYLAAAPIEAPPRNDVRVVRAQVQSTEARLTQVAAWAVAGAVVPQVTQQFQLSEARRAYEASENGHVRGKIVLTMG